MRKEAACLEDLTFLPQLFFFGQQIYTIFEKQIYTIFDTDCSCIHYIIYYQLKYNIKHSFMKNPFVS